MAKGTMIIDGQRVAFDGEKNVLSVIRKAGIDMPTFCYYTELSTFGACRLCIVEDERGKIDSSCSMEPRDGMVIKTNSARLLKHRRMILELMLASHNCECTTCEKSGKCHLQELAEKFGVRKIRFQDTREPQEKDESSFAIVRDPNKCVLCGDCVRVCDEMQGVGVIDFARRGSNLKVMPAFNRKLSETKCVSCGQCAAVCPTGAITIRNEIGDAWRAIHDPKKRVVVQIAPAVRVAVGEAFGLPAGTNVLDKMVTALKLMGVDEVYDTNFAADFTTILESAEFLERVKAGGPFPMFTSCCPAWVKYVETALPQYLPNISSCKSPMHMFAALLKDRYAEKDAADGKTTYHIAIMPCTAKKMEGRREEFKNANGRDVDLVLTSYEFIEMAKEMGIRLPDLELESPDLPFGMSTGSAALYGTTGGVAEAVLRHCLPDKSKNALRVIRQLDLGNAGKVKEAVVDVNGVEVRAAVVNGLANVKPLLKEIEEGKKFYHLIEVMTCASGCTGGAGQPKGTTAQKYERGAGLHQIDDASLLKRAERNPVVNAILKDMDEEKQHELFHVHYGETK